LKQPRRVLFAAWSGKAQAGGASYAGAGLPFPIRSVRRSEACPPGPSLSEGRAKMLDLSPPVAGSDPPSPAANMTDALLVARAQRDPAAFAPLYEAYFAPVYRYCYHRLGGWEAAEDAAGVVFANALAALPRYRNGGGAGSFRSWLFAIAHNVVANRRREAGRSAVPLVAAGEIPDAGPSPEEAVLAVEAARSVHAVLDHLPPDQRRVLELRLAGLTDAEIGQVLGRSRGAVRTAQYRAVQRLRVLLQPEGEARDA
jgi:RNA polymerase sigma-70 factor (ECF subfamily)